MYVCTCKYLALYNKHQIKYSRMSKNDFINLYEKYKSGECTSAEIEALENFKDHFQSKDHDWIPEMGNRELVQEELYTRLKQELDHSKKNSRITPFIRWAAAIVVVSSVTIFYYTNRSKKQDTQNTALAVSKFETKTGEKKLITLKDGTLVWLNSESSLTVAGNFNESTRNVSLIGEAYFDVKHQNNKPFKVHTSGFDVNVLGTAFNVKAYPGEEMGQTTLVRGKIAIKNNQKTAKVVNLIAGQKITFLYKVELKEPKIKKLLAKEEIEPKVIIGSLTTKDNDIVETAWSQNKLILDNKSFTEAKPILERWFNVKIEIADKIVEDYRFTATFKKENIFEVLSSLQKVKFFNYKKKGEKIIITK